MICLQLFLAFFKVGLFCFGGAFGMIPLIEETVLANGWLTESEFYDLIGICESTPGPIAVNTATYVGATQAGIWGSLSATLGVVLPSFLIILLIASVLNNLTDNPYFKAFIKGVKPVVIALILSTGLILLAKSVGYASPLSFVPQVIPMVIFSILVGVYLLAQYVWKRKIPAVAMILMSAILGIGVSMIFNA